MKNIFELNEDGQLKNRWVNARQLADRSIDELLGIGKGMLADAVINIDEVNFLFRWLEANAAYVKQWPANILSERIIEIMSDGIVDEGEKEELFNLLNEITGGTKTFYDSLQNNSATLPLCSPPPKVVFASKLFCFTGRFLYGTRSRCEKEVINRGGDVESNITKKTEYLIVGHLGSTDWRHTSFGRKIESAVKFRDSGVPISIISEEHWVNFCKRK